MPAWNEITRTEQYQRLPEQARAKLKSEWFLKNLDPEVEKRPALKEVGREKVFEWFMQQPDDTGQNIVTSTLGSAARGFGEVVPGAIEGAGALTGIEEIRGAGQAVRGVLEDVAPVNPIYEEGIPAKVANVGGQVGSMFATAGIGGLAGKGLAGAKIAAGATAAEQAALAAQAVGRGAKTASYLSAGLQGAAGGAQEAERYGLEGADAYLRTLAGAATELGSEALPFGTLAETAAARRLLGETVQGAPGIRQAAFAEGAEEAAAQVGGNIATQALAPLGTETPGLLEGVPEAAGLGAVGGGMFGALNRLTTPRTPTVATPPPVQPATDTTAEVAANVAATDEGEVAPIAAPDVGTPVTLDGQNYTVSIPTGSPISPDALAGFYDDPETLQALHESGRIRLEQVIAPTETVDTTPLNNNIAASAPFAPQVTKTMKEIADEEALSQPAVTTAQETPVAPAESDGGSLGQMTPAAGGSSPDVTAATVPQEPVVSSAEIAPAEDPFAAVEEPQERQIAEEDRAEFEEFQELLSRRGPARSKVKGVSFTKKDEARFQELGAKHGHYLFDRVNPQEDPVVGEDINGSPIQQSPTGTYYTVEGGRVRTGPAFKDDPEFVREQNELLKRQSPQPAPKPPASKPPASKPVRPKRPKKAPAPPAAEVQQQPIEETPAAPTPLAGPLRPKFEAGETVAFKVNGHPVIGTIQRVSGGGSATVTYNWNGKKDQEIVLRTSEIQRPVLAVAEEPTYKYTQEQNARKAARFGLPTEPGVTVDAGPVIKGALERIASDTAMPQMSRAVARALQNQNYDGVDLRIEADGRRWYAGYYLNDNGITEIGINLRLVGRGQVDAVSVLLHEALHHVTLAKVRDPQGEIETQAVEALDTLRKRVKVYAGMQQKATKFSYELGTVDEFITALFTRPDFQDFLASIPDTFTPGTPGSKFRSVLSEIFRIIAQLVTGQKVQKGGILDQSFASTLALFETPQRIGSTDGEAAMAEDVEPVFTPDEARAILTKRFGKAVADKFNIEVMAPRRMGNREVEVDAELRGGTISLNLKFMDSEELLIQKAEHEMAHAVYSDKGVQDAWRELSASMPPDVRQRITDRMKEAGYDYRVLNEEVLVRFLEEVRANTSPSKWKAFMDAVIDAFRRFFGAMPDERTARLAAARIIAAGEAAVARGLDPSKQAFGQSVATQRDTVPSRKYPGMIGLEQAKPHREVIKEAQEAITRYKKASESKDKIKVLEDARDAILRDPNLSLSTKAVALDLMAQQGSVLADLAQRDSDSQVKLDDYSMMTATASGVLESDPAGFANFKFTTIDELMKMASEAGRTLNIWNAIARLTPEGFLRSQERIRTRQVNEATEQQFGVTPQRLLELMWRETEKAEKAAVEKAKAEIKRRSPESIAKAAIARLNEMMAGPPRPRGKPSEISEMIRKHLNSPVEGFIDKLVALGVEKETAEALDAISGTVRADLAKLAEANAVKRLTESLKPKTRAAKSAIPRLLRVLLEAGKTGAFDSKAFNDALGEAFDFPPMTAEQEAEIRRMVTEINKLPQGAARVDKQQELQNYVALVQGVPARDMLLSAWYANVLSGISTQLIGLVGNSMNTALRSAFLAVTSPNDFKSYLRGALGVGKDAGIEEVKAALKGRGAFKVGRLDSPEIANALEVLFRKGPTTPAEWVAYVASAGTYLRMVFRIMGAIDAFFWNSAREGMYHLAASRTVRKMAKEKGMTEEEANAEFIRQLGGGPEAYEAALKDAEATLIKAGQPADMATMDRMAREAIDKARAEINPAAVQAANRWADRMVLQQEPEGVGKIISALIKAVQSINVAGFPLGQMLVPFNKIVSNLFEQSLDYTGLGLVRAALGMHISDARIDWNRKGIPGISPAKGAKVFDEVERRERAMAGFVGLTLSAAAYVAAKANMGDDDDEVPFMIYAFGPTDKNKREQMPDGWVPFSIKVGDTYYRYAEWPLGMVLAGFGAALDAERYGNMKEKDTLDRIGYSAMLGLKGFMTQGVLSSVDTAIDVLMFKATGKKYTDIPVNAAKGLIPAQGFLRDVSGLFDNTKVSNDDIAAALMKDIPVVKSLGTKPELNVFGEPTLMEGEAVLRRFLTQRRPHPAADYLTRNKLYIPGMDETVTIGQYLPPTERDRFKRRAMQMEAMENGVFTPEQNYNFRKRAGELTKSAVERIMKQAPAIRTEQQRKAVQNLIDKQVGLARRRAMVEAVPYQPPPAQ